MRLTFDLTGADGEAAHNPYAPAAGPRTWLDLAGLAGLLAARVAAAAGIGAAAMAAAHRGLAAAVPDLTTDTDGAGGLVLGRPDTGADGAAFTVPLARVRLACTEVLTEAVVAVDAVGTLPAGLRLGNLSAAAFPAGLERTPEFARYRRELLGWLAPDGPTCAEWLAAWEAQVAAPATLRAAGGAPVPAAEGPAALQRAVRARLGLGPAAAAA